MSRTSNISPRRVGAAVLTASVVAAGLHFAGGAMASADTEAAMQSAAAQAQHEAASTRGPVKVVSVSDVKTCLTAGGFSVASPGSELLTVRREDFPTTTLTFKSSIQSAADAASTAQKGFAANVVVDQARTKMTAAARRDFGRCILPNAA